jgi:hypothetical protein
VGLPVDPLEIAALSEVWGDSFFDVVIDVRAARPAPVMHTDAQTHTYRRIR